ncbi:hypothetical protein LX97_00999 [Nonlabens dokdonensis]|jgi:hypothetical protein|uniref:DUF2975 domain-containing protein n=2 Tax=Nonlabens dokdonensis TaxID=328515 RepID=L7W805_NONDD|nr:hypothetical protein [Nonlabens dokdonensis]AGC76332.1 hypothetical protein DDD_1205 [Nonlabens dokdonensis DSW-6]PZX43994.1 hypothetical protein LX97_00999 [Nonlabens dokdonensis]
MKISWLSTLRAIMTLVYFFAWLSAIGAPISIILFSSGVESAFESLGIKIYNVHWTFYGVLALSIIGYWLFLAMIHHLRKASYRITPYRFMDTRIERHFYYAGLFCVVGSLVTKVPAVIYKYTTMAIVKSNKILLNDVSIDFGFSFDSFMVILAFGIFLIIISKIIKQSILIQEENDLTI